ncbi:MFS transporter [Cryptosporangium sp. NPDC051539]|uniref:MFS transporter n=1 Tax=Cryptosporangium sp. NPDC051539 TaxID=3363962 RepID=UPI0037992ABA
MFTYFHVHSSQLIGSPPRIVRGDRRNRRRGIRRTDRRYARPESRPSAERFHDLDQFATARRGPLSRPDRLAILLAVSPDGIAADGWRIGFLAAGLLGLVAFWIRTGAQESNALELERPAHPTGRRTLLRAHLRPLLAVFLLTVGVISANYYFSLSMPVYLDSIGAVAEEDSAGQMPVITVVFIVLTVAAGWLADRVGGLPMARAGMVCVAVATVPITVALASRELPFLPGMVLYVAFVAIGFSPIGTLVTRPMPAPIRVLGVGLAGTAAVVLVGGTLPLVVQALTAAGHRTLVPWYVAALAVVGLAGSLIVRSTDVYPKRVVVTDDAVPRTAPEPSR